MSDNYDSSDEEICFSEEETSSSTEEKIKIKTKKIIYAHIIDRKNYEFFYRELRNFRNILTDFVDKHTMYAMLTNVINKDNYIIIKFGYTYNIIQRIKEIYSSHKTFCFPIRLIEINAEKEEKYFHKILKGMFEKSQYKENEFNKSNPTSKEFYYGVPNVIEAFDNYSKTIVLKHMIPLKIEQEKTEQEKEKTEQEKEKTKQKELEIIDKYGIDCFIKYYEIKKNK